MIKVERRIRYRYISKTSPGKFFLGAKMRRAEKDTGFPHRQRAMWVIPIRTALAHPGS